MSDLVNFHPNERVDLGDMERLRDAPVDDSRLLVRELIAERTTLNGFAFTVDSATSLRISLGAAFLATAPPGQASVAGQLTAEGVSSQVLSFSGQPVGLYDVWIRHFAAPGQQENRVFWDAAADVEDLQIVTVRLVSGWNAVLAAQGGGGPVSPGPEWTRIWEISWNGATLATSILADRRNHLFEGAHLDLYAGAAHTGGTAVGVVHPSDWGGGTDRDQDRGTYGVKDLTQFTEMVRQKLYELQTGTNPSV
ncbi:MAG TPA: hypothetical protein VMX12_06020, partial [Acidimicrobiia bacterium]|nr:hypothetical protein [Acidimicrobiia bacterium]